MILVLAVILECFSVAEFRFHNRITVDKHMGILKQTSGISLDFSGMNLMLSFRSSIIFIWCLFVMQQQCNGVTSTDH